MLILNDGGVCRVCSVGDGQEEVLSDVLRGKSDTVVFCNVSDVQRELYLNVLALPEFQLLKRLNTYSYKRRIGRTYSNIPRPEIPGVGGDIVTRVCNGHRCGMAYK